MQLYLTKPFNKLHVSDGVDVEFTGEKLRIFSNGFLTDSLDATAGECYNVLPNEKSNSVTVDKVPMPATRGRKIAWAISPLNEEHFATSFADFQERFFDTTFDSTAAAKKSAHIICEMNCNAYAFMIEKDLVDNELKVTSISFWISDKISQKDLAELLSCYKKHYKVIRSNEEFLKIL